MAKFNAWLKWGGESFITVEAEDEDEAINKAEIYFDDHPFLNDIYVSNSYAERVEEDG